MSFKKITLNGFLILLLILLSCDSNNKLTPTIEIQEFSVEVIKDTVPGEVLVINNIKIEGGINYYLIHPGAFLDIEGEIQRDSSWYIVSNDHAQVYTDTFSLFYLNEGAYQVSLELLGKNYTEEFEIYSRH